MYTDPANIRKHIVKICLNDEEFKMLNLVVEAVGGQSQVVARDFFNIGAIERGADILLEHKDYKRI